MPATQNPFPSRPRVFTSATAATTFSPPIGWVQMVAAGTLVMVGEDGTAYTDTSAAAGDTIMGPFKAFTSTTSSKIRLGDGPPPPPNPAASVADVYQSLQSTQGEIVLGPKDFSLLTGAPLAIFANGASAVPGSAIVDSKLFGVRWNDNATNAGILSSFKLPADCDITQPLTVRVRAGKTGATALIAPTFAIGLFNNATAATWDADTNFGGTTPALSDVAAAKTIQEVTLSALAADLAAGSGITITVKPTDGTLPTDDDLVLVLVVISYKTKLLAS